MHKEAPKQNSKQTVINIRKLLQNSKTIHNLQYQSVDAA